MLIIPIMKNGILTVCGLKLSNINHFKHEKEHEITEAVDITKRTAVKVLNAYVQFIRDICIVPVLIEFLHKKKQTSQEFRSIGLLPSSFRRYP